MRVLLSLFALTLFVPAPVQAATYISLPPFRSVQLRGGGNVIVVPGPVQRVSLVQGSTQFTKFSMREGGELRIDACDMRCPQNYDLKIRIESPHVPNAAIAGGGVISAAGGFAPQSQVSAAIHGGGKIDLRAVEANDVSAAINGGGEVLVHPRSVLSAA